MAESVTPKLSLFGFQSHWHHQAHKVCWEVSIESESWWPRPRSVRPRISTSGLQTQVSLLSMAEAMVPNTIDQADFNGQVVKHTRKDHSDSCTKRVSHDDRTVIIHIPNKRLKESSSMETKKALEGKNSACGIPSPEMSNVRTQLSATR